MRILAVTFLSLSLFLQACGDSSDAEGPELLFVQSATSAEIENSRLILGGLSPVGWFTDRPYRDAGNVLTRDFIQAWQGGSNSFAENPPNASLVCEAGSQKVIYFVELSSPSFDERMGVLTYAIRDIEGSSLPSRLECSGRGAHLFIDALRGDEM